MYTRLCTPAPPLSLCLTHTEPTLVCGFAEELVLSAAGKRAAQTQVCLCSIVFECD